MEHWTDNFEHEKLETLDAQESFKRTMGKFKSLNDVPIAYMELEKEAGKNFKLPKAIESLPSEDMRRDFTEQTMKLLGIEQGVGKPEDLGDVNWVKGMPAGSEPSQPLVEAFTKFAVENKLTKGMIQSLIEFNNAYGMEMMNKQQQMLKENVDAASTALRTYFGEPGLKEHLELMRRAFQNNAKLTPGEFEQVASDLADDGILFGKPVLLKGFLNLLAPLAKEGKTETGGSSAATTTTKTAEQKFKETDGPAAEVLGIR